MRLSIVSLLLATLAAHVDAERVLGAYIFSRHGDRTPKVFKNAKLTSLGYRQVFDAGSYYHNRYVAADSDRQIEGINDTFVDAKQISASSPSDAVLQNSATGFLQGVYPPVGEASAETLGNDTVIKAPLNGNQLVSLTLTSSGKNSEDSTWLQGASSCEKAGISSNDYYSSDSYNQMLESTKDFYQSLSPLVNGVFSSSQLSFRNAYTIFDYLNVDRIHNKTSKVTDEQYLQLLALASNQQYNLAYNESDKVRAMDGAVLTGEILTGLNETITSKGKSKLNVQFGSYGTFFSFFGLAQLPAASVNFTGVVDYASSMVLELVTNATGNAFPESKDISVRFLFHNGTMTGSDEPAVYPLFGQSKTLLPWSDFVSEAEKIAVTDDAEWCQMCGNTDGKCASASSGAASTNSSGSSGSGGISRAVAGVIGAMVTLAVILGLEALFFLVGGFRIAKRTRAGSRGGSVSEISEDKKA
ncbi:hypothetical protein N7512_003676 [Penicillium capsulatum]|nr:hypothetical protein N7512_003676 [Penicillium capsulatum]